MRKLVPVAAVLAALFTVPPLAAVSTRRFEFGEFRQWESAALAGVKVSSEGEVLLGLEAREAETPEKEIWGSLVARDGRTWFTTGNAAALYRVDASGAAPRAEKVFQADEVAFSCLAEAPDGRLFLGSLPAGRIYVVDAKGEGKVFTTLPAPYVWTLKFAPDGHLLAGTGPEGVIYRISPNGEAKIHYDSHDGNILSLALSPGGELYAGSAAKGLLYRIKKAGEAEVVWDFHGREVKALVFHGSTLYAAVNNAQGRLGTPGAREAGRSALEFSSLARKLAGKFDGAEVSQEGAELSSENSLLKRYDSGTSSTLEEVTPEGRVETVWELADSSILDLAADASGTLYAATAKAGRVYSVVPRGTSHLLLTAEEAQAVTLAVDRGRLAFIGHANPGNAVVVGAKPPATGTLTTRALDSGFPSRFGLARWDGAGPVKLATRSGNTGKPDHTWSAWSAPAGPPPMPAGAPPGRYLQARIEITGGGAARLTNLQLYYLNQNQKPRVEAVLVGPGQLPEPRESGDTPQTGPNRAGAERAGDLKKMAEALAMLNNRPPAGKDTSGLGDGPPAGPGDRPDGRPSAAVPERSASAIKEVRWTAEDKDGDPLVFRLHFQGAGEPDWVPLTPREPVEGSSWSWDTESVPDGRYVLRVTASDERANPTGEGLASEKNTVAFVVDNSRPEVVARETSPGRLEIVARDALSPIARAEVAVDGQEWKPLHPRDRIADGVLESYDWTLPPLPPGPHAVAVRAADAEGNVGATRLFVRVRTP